MKGKGGLEPMIRISLLFECTLKKTFLFFLISNRQSRRLERLVESLAFGLLGERALCHRHSSEMLDLYIMWTRSSIYKKKKDSSQYRP